MPRREVFKVCPRCGSTAIEYASMMREATGTVVGLGLPARYYCWSCGYEGALVLEMARRDLERAWPKLTHTAYRPRRLAAREGAEALKPLFSIAVLAFFVLGALLLFPRPLPAADLPAEVVAQLNISIRDGLGLGSVKAFAVPGGYFILPSPAPPSGGIRPAFISTQNTSLAALGSATGFVATPGLLLPLFLLFFILGFLSLMIYAHWHRAALFG